LVSKQLLADICNSQAIVELIMVAYKMGAQEPVLLASDYNINGIKFEVSSGTVFCKHSPYGGSVLPSASRG